MSQISEKEFYLMIFKNPSVFEHWDTPLEIIEYVDCNNSLITHLSPYLIFSGRTENGNVANFSDCKKLKIATGTFHGNVSFFDSGIEKIENLIITQANTNKQSASFIGCQNLKTATGSYSNYVNFCRTGIHSIQNLEVKKPRQNGEYADFSNCPNLETLEGWDLSKHIYIEKEKLANEKKRRASLQNFHRKNQPTELPFL
jgi:hypothetical protein